VAEDPKGEWWLKTPAGSSGDPNGGHPQAGQRLKTPAGSTLIERAALAQSGHTEDLIRRLKTP